MQRKRSTRRSFRRKKTWAQKCKDYIRNFIAFLFSNVGIIGLVIGYTIAGSLMFQKLEGLHYESRLSKVKKLRFTTVAKLWRTTSDINIFEEETWYAEVEKALRVFQESIVNEVLEYGYEGEEFVSNKWSFSGAFLYSLTVITTIGYGNVAPKTEVGKLATVLYAIAGMPLFLLYLSNIGDVLAKSFKWTYAKCCLCTSCQFRRHRPPASIEEPPTRLDDLSEESSISIYDPQTVTVPITLCLAIMVGYVYGGAILFGKWENWPLLDGAYFCFISLSTIGFGDIVPGDLIRKEEGLELSFIFCSMYLMLGMALIAMCFNLMQEEVVHKIRTCGDTVRRLTRCRR